MRIRTFCVPALLAATALWLAFSSSAQACETATCKSTAQASAPLRISTDAVRHRRAGRRHVAHVRKWTRSARHAAAVKTAAKTQPDKTQPAKTATTDAADDSRPETRAAQMPPSVADAHAEVPTSRTLAEDEARNFAALDDDELKRVDGMEVAATDPAADTDQAVADTPPPVAAAAPSVPAEPPRPAASMPLPTVPAFVAPRENSDLWNRTSLLGKFFVAFGSLLTLASAARMLMA